MANLLATMHADDGKTAQAWAETFSAAHSVIRDLRLQHVTDRQEVLRWMDGATNLREHMLHQESEAALYLNSGRKLFAEKTEDQAWQTTTRDLRMEVRAM